jgi:glutamate dehydrogenase
MTDSRALQKQTLLEQLADVLQNQASDNDDSLELREIVARMVEESRSWDDDLHGELVRSFGKAHPGRKLGYRDSGVLL